MDIANLAVAVKTTGVREATRDLDKLGNQSAATAREAHKMGKVFGTAIGLISSAALISFTRSAVRQADAYALMSAKIGLVTKGQVALLGVQNQLFMLSQRTGSDLKETTDLYVKLAQSSDHLRGNQAELLRITELVSKSLVVSGADAASSAAVIRQFSQALAAGALRGDEFVSVMEGAPRLARALADGLNVPIGKLREMAEAGELTADRVTGALLRVGDKIDGEFSRMPVTVGRAMQKVENSLLSMIGKTDQAAGASQGLANAISDLADTLGSPQTQQAFADTATGIARITEAAIVGARELGGFLGDLRATLAGPKSDDLKRQAANIKAMKELIAQRDKDFGANTPFLGTTRLRAELAEMERSFKHNQQEAIAPGIRAQLDAAYAPLAKPGRTVAITTNTDRKAKAAATRELTEAEKLYQDVMETGLLIDEQVNEFRRTAISLEYDKVRAVDEGVARTSDMIADMQFELDLLGMTAAQREKAIALRYADAAATAEQIVQISALADATARAREQQQFADDTQRSLTESVGDFAKGSRSAKEAFGDFADDLFERAVKLMAERAIQQLMGSFNGTGGATSNASSGWGGVISGVMSLFGGGWGGIAKGGAFGGGQRIDKFAMGGVFDKAQMFQHGDRMGVLGEAGPEAILPLHRGPDGKLGVRVAEGASSGGGQVVNNSTTFLMPSLVTPQTQSQVAQRQQQSATRAVVRNR